MAHASPDITRKGFQHFRALTHRNFRLFFYGQSISLIGTWMQVVAQSWLVYRLTNSPFLLGLVGFTSQIPTFILAPYAGVIADRYNRHRLLIWTQVLSMVQALMMAILVLTHTVTIWQIVVLSLFLGVVNAFDMAIRQSFTIEMIEDKKDLANAIALNSSIVNGSRLIGPAIAGILIASFGEGVCFVINGLSYIAVITALCAMKIKQKTLVHRGGHVLKDLKEGLQYAFNSVPIRSILLLLTVVSSMTGVFQTLVPVFVKDVYFGGPKLFGFLITTSGVGAFLAAVYLAGRKTVLGLSRIIIVSAGVLGAAVIVFALTDVLLIAAFFSFMIGLAMIIAIGGSNIVLQTVVEEDKRGRIMSLYGAAFIGMTPVGNLLAGILADQIGVRSTMVLGGIGCLLAAYVFWRHLPGYRAKIRSVYVEKGIIPEPSQ